MTKDEVIEKLWENSGHGTRRGDIEAAYASGELNAQVPLAKWDALRAWLENGVKECAYGGGSISESIYAAGTMKDVLAQMAKMEASNAK
jgi:hypothetical protein